MFAQTNFPTDHLIVRLNFKLLDFDKIDNVGFDNQKLGNYLNPEGKNYLSSIKDSLLNLGDLELKKLFPHLKISDSISISRQGKKISMPPFWATFIIDKPKNVDFKTFLNTINNFYPLIIYAHPDYEGEPDNLPNDELFANQISLYSFTQPNSHINIDSAWSIETGKKFIKVGVFDTGVDSAHIELDLLTGWGYNQDPLHEWGVDYFDHGTPVAGIIGAKRNNSIGIAGIAGGDGSDTTGVSLIDFKIMDNFGYANAQGASVAIIDAARSVGSYYNWDGLTDLGPSPYLINSPGYGIHIGNHSYALKVQNSIKIQNEKVPVIGGGSDGDDDLGFIGEFVDCQLCRESFLFSLQNGVINVVSRGNHAVSDLLTPAIGLVKYPASYDDSWVVSVGSSGIDGNWLDGLTNNSFNEAYYSYYGRSIDLIAPGTDSIIVTTKSSQADTSDIEYRHFRGSSAAAPHVSGVTALLLSKYNKNCYSNINLDQADVEYILQKSAVDVMETGYDVRAGWGRLDAHKAMKMIDFPKYQIIHPENAPDTIIQLESDTITFFLNKPLQALAGGPLGSQFTLQLERHYRVERIKHELTYDFSEFILPGSTQLLDTWVRHSQTNTLQLINDTTNVWQILGLTGQYGWVSESDTFKVEPFATITSVDTVNKKIKLTGYTYHFIGKYTFGIDNGIVDNENFWYPINPSEDSLKMAYSIYIRDTTLQFRYDFPCTADNLMYDSLAGIHSLSKDLSSLEMTIYPNPGNTLNVLLSVPFDQGILKLINTSGQVIQKTGIVTERKEYAFNVENLKQGLYFINAFDQNGLIISKKWIKL